MTSVGGRIIATGAFLAGLAVAIGAFGAHALEERVSADMLANYETGAHYHFLHALGMIAVGLLALFRSDRDGADEGVTWAAALVGRADAHRRGAVLRQPLHHGAHRHALARRGDPVRRGLLPRRLGTFCPRRTPVVTRSIAKRETCTIGIDRRNREPVMP